VKNESKRAQWKLGAACKGGSRKLVGGFEFWGRNGVKMASTLPFLNFHVRHAHPSELMIAFSQKDLYKVVLFIVIFFFVKIL